MALSSRLLQFTSATLLGFSVTHSVVRSCTHRMIHSLEFQLSRTLYNTCNSNKNLYTNFCSGERTEPVGFGARRSNKMMSPRRSQGLTCTCFDPSVSDVMSWVQFSASNWVIYVFFTAQVERKMRSTYRSISFSGNHAIEYFTGSPIFIKLGLHVSARV